MQLVRSPEHHALPTRQRETIIVHTISRYVRICDMSIHQDMSEDNIVHPEYDKSESNKIQSEFQCEFITHQHLFSANLTFLALWKVASQTIFHLPADMFSSNFQAAPGFVSPVCHLPVRVHPTCADESMFQPLSDCSDLYGCSSLSQIPC